MVLLVEDSYNVEFFVLWDDRSEGIPVYSLQPWREPVIAQIAASGSPAVPDVALNAVTQGVPIPLHGSLFGWICDADVTALVAVYAEYTPTRPKPSWAVMPLVGVEEAKWPPFTGERVFGHWFWEHYRAGNIICLSNVIAHAPGAVFWVDTKEILGSDCCTIVHDIRNGEGHTLRRGRYVYHQLLRAGQPVPSLKLLLAGAEKTDLSLRFETCEYSPG